MTPTDHGYAKCNGCLCWRPRSELLSDEGEQTGEEILYCLDVALCVRLEESRWEAKGGIPRGPELNEGVGG